MRQLITRIEPELHERLKQRALAEGRSVNALVTELLMKATSAGHERASIRARAEAAGLAVAVTPERPPPTRDDAIAATKGAGTAASEALRADRSKR